jgi:hypothetical protein
LLDWCDTAVPRTTTEAERRAVIAHAYYACYHMYVSGIQSTFPDCATGIHERMIQIGIHHAAPKRDAVQRKKMEKWLQMLNELRRDRADAHYILTADISHAKMQRCVAKAHDMIDNLHGVGAWAGDVESIRALWPRQTR